MPVPLPPLSQNLSRCQASGDLPWHDAAAYWQGAEAGKILRMLDDGSVRSAIVRLAPWARRAADGACDATVQGYVLSGAVVIGDQEIGQGGFFVVPTGQPWPVIGARSAAELLLIFDNPKTAQPVDAEAVVIADTAKAEPIVPVIDGVRLEGFARRVLWEDPNTGADTRLLTVPAGFEGKGPNWHPVHEEIFCLAGDIGPDDTRLMTPGTYLHNPAFGIHGYHEHSVGGATVLEWHDGLWAIKFTD